MNIYYIEIDLLQEYRVELLSCKVYKHQGYVVERHYIVNYTLRYKA